MIRLIHLEVATMHFSAIRSLLFDKERLMEFYQTLHSDKVPTTVKQGLEALLKGEEGNLYNQF